MPDAWQILRDAGLPLAFPRTSSRPTPLALGTAAREAIASNPTGRDADALVAFLRAWEQHWPSSFRSALAEDARAVSAWAAAHVGDPDRYLKLRRIAVENLASLL